jgi:nucleoside phosphorylase/CheY-like chemotaxis protein
MMRILIVEDTEGKANKVRSGINEQFPLANLQMTWVADANAAKTDLRKIYYDLVILDIAIPLRQGDTVDPNGGIHLLREVISRGNYLRPGHVIGLTGRSDVYETASDEFSTEIWSVVYFDFASDIWLDRISSKIRHIMAADSARSTTNVPEVDVAIIVAVQDELEQVKRNGWNWRQKSINGDSTVYYDAEYTQYSGRQARAVAAKAPLMGMSAASILATKMGYNFKPRVVVMPGICAGDSNEVSLGDLIGGNPVWDYGNGKHSVVGDERKFEPAPYQIPIKSRIRGMLERLKEDNDVLESIWEAFPGKKPTGRPAVHIGPFASGAAVVANKDIFNEIQDLQHRKLLGLDMEAYGVMAACEELLYPQPECLVFKGVSDFADTDKGDSYRHYAAFVSAQLITQLCEKYDL